MAAVVRDLRTAPNLAREIARVLDKMAREEAVDLHAGKQPLPADADWLTRHYYTEIKRERDEKNARDQERAWAEHMALQERAPSPQ